MTWGIDAIKAAYDRGEAQGASHMIVSHDSIDFDQMVTYVMPGEDPHKVWDKSLAKSSGYGGVDECYRYSLGWEFQSKERRANHWEWEPIIEAISFDPGTLSAPVFCTVHLSDGETKTFQGRKAKQVYANNKSRVGETFRPLLDAVGNPIE